MSRGAPDYWGTSYQSKIAYAPEQDRRWESVMANGDTQYLMIVNENKILHLCGMVLSILNATGTTRSFSVDITNNVGVIRVRLVYRYATAQLSDWMPINFDPPALMTYSNLDRIRCITAAGDVQLRCCAWGFETTEFTV